MKPIRFVRSRCWVVVAHCVPALTIASAARAQESLPSVQVSTSAHAPGDLSKPFPGDQQARGARLGVLGETDVMNAPFSVHSYTSQAIENSQATSIVGAISRVDPSVREEYGSGTSTDALIIRGFPVGNDEMSLNGLPGMLGQFRVSSQFIERAEVLKGSSAFLNGMSPNGAVGGNVNLVSKRAADSPLTQLSTGFSGKSIFGFNADIGRRFGQDHEFGLRLNAGARQGDTAREHLSDKTRNLSLGLDYKGSRVRASLDLIYQTQLMRGVSVSTSLAALGQAAIAAPDGRRNVAQPWNYQESEDKTVMGEVEVDLADRLTAFAAIGHADIRRRP